MLAGIREVGVPELPDIGRDFARFAAVAAFEAAGTASAAITAMIAITVSSSTSVNALLLPTPAWEAVTTAALSLGFIDIELVDSRALEAER